MTKLKFLLSLNDKLSGLPQEDVEERLNFYAEMIEDRMKEGLSEEEAVAAIGSVEEIAAHIRRESPPTASTVAVSMPKKRLGVWEIVLLVLGAPIWLSLLVAGFAVVFSLYITLWAVVVSLWAVFASLAGCVIGCIAIGTGLVLGGKHLTGIALLGTGCVCAGLSIFSFLGCRAATEGSVKLTKCMGLWIKKCFTKKEAA